MINKYTNKKSTAIMTVVLALAMVFAGVAIVASDVDADVAENDVAKIGDQGFATLNNALTASVAGDTITILENATAELYDNNIQKNVTITGSTGSILKVMDAYTCVYTDVTIENITINPESEGCLLGFGCDVTLNNVVSNILTLQWNGGDFEADRCQFNVGIQIQTDASSGQSTEISNSTINFFEMNAQNGSANIGEDIILTGTEIDTISLISSMKIGDDVDLVVDYVTISTESTGTPYYDTVSITGTGSLTTTINVVDGVTLTNDLSKLTLVGDNVINGTFVNNGYMVNNGTMSGNGDFENNGTVEKEGQLGLKDTINSDTTLEADSYLSGDLVIPEGKTLIIKSGVTFDMLNYDLIINGKLIVEKKATVVSNGGEIRLGLTGVFENAGIVGEKNVITIRLVDIDDANEYGTISMKGLTGVEFSITKVKGTTPSYYLTVSGDVSKIGKENGKLDINGAYIGDLTIDDATGDINGAILMKGCTLTIDSNATMNLTGAPALNMQAATLIIDGKLTATSGTVTMVNGSIVTVNGVSNATFNTVTGVFETYNGDKKVTAEEVYADSSITTDNLEASSVTLTEGKITGITIEVTTSTEIDEDDKSWTTQMMNISGDLAYNVNPAEKKGEKYDAGSITLIGHICVPGELVFAKNMTVNGDYDVCVTGTVTAESNVFDEKYVAAYYTVESVDADGEDVITHYYTNFDNAYANIATADDMTITIRGDYTFEKEYIIADEQTLNLVATTVDDVKSKFIISKDSKITVMDGGIVEGDKDITSIKGILVVMDGGDCVPDASAYEVKSVDADDNITYTSAELAISMAQSGDVIEIVGAVTFDDAVTIPEGVTVKVNEGATITAEKDLIVNGKIVNEGEVEAKKNLKVAGEIESVDGELTFDEMTVTGTVTVETAYTTDNINAATFEGDDGQVYTTVAAAVAATAGEDNPVAVTVLGKVNESAEVALAEGQTLTIKGEVTIDIIRLVVDSKLDIVSGNLTADVVAAVGTTDALADSVIGMNKVTATASPAEVTVTYSEKDDLYTMKLNEFGNGDVVIESGAVSYTNASLEVTADKTFKVAAGAQLDIDNPVAFSGTLVKSFVNEGTIDVTVGSSFTGLDIAGTVNVAKDVTLTIAGGNVIGVITGGDIAITADVKVGTAPKTLGATGSISGKVTLTSGEYVTVYAGSAFVDTTEDSNIKSTAYTVNGIAYATVYAVSGVIGVLDNEICNLDDLNATTIAWKDADGNDVASNAAIGTPDAVYAEVAYEAADITVSAGPGLIVYIDDLKVEDNTTSLKVGTHTITVYVDAGYEGTPVIKLNGTEIIDGKIVVTSDMVGSDKDNMLVITGATPATSQPVVIQPSDSEKDGMELTDILLIVLVVLIVIMAIIVALRMMRS